MIILMIHDGRSSYCVKVLQSNFLTYMESTDVPAGTLPVNFWFCKDVIKWNVGLCFEKKTMPFSITQRKTKLNLDFYTQLLKRHVSRTLDKCLTTFHTVFK